MEMKPHDLNNLVIAAFPAREQVVEIEHVYQTEGVFAAMAACDSVTVGWRLGCNDWPEVGQRWLVRLLGFDVATGTLIAQALMREE